MYCLGGFDFSGGRMKKTILVIMMLLIGPLVVNADSQSIIAGNSADVSICIINPYDYDITVVMIVPNLNLSDGWNMTFPELPIRIDKGESECITMIVKLNMLVAPGSYDLILDVFYTQIGTTKTKKMPQDIGGQPVWRYWEPEEPPGDEPSEPEGPQILDDPDDPIDDGIIDDNGQEPSYMICYILGLILFVLILLGLLVMKRRKNNENENK